MQVLTDAITADQMSLVGTDPNVTFEILSETFTSADVSYDVRFTGDGQQYVFDLQFVRDTGTTAVLGSVPVTLTRHYVRLTEDSDFQTLYEDNFNILANQAALQIQFADLQFDTTDVDSINDAFELALLDADGNPLVGTIGHDRDAFFNITEGETAALGGGVQYDSATGTITLDISHLAAGTAVTLAARLVNNDSDTTTTVTLEPWFTQLTTSPVANPSTSTTPPIPATPRVIDFNDLADVTAAVSVFYTQTSFDEESDTLFAGLTLNNSSTIPVRGPLLVAVHHIDDPSVRATGYDGITPDGRAYYDVTHLLPGGILTPAAILSGLTLQFHNPQQVQFDYELQILADLNQPPLFVSNAVLEAVAGKPYQYDALATDPDNDVLMYSLVSGPSDLMIDAATGVVTWNPTASGTGAYMVVLQATDPLGLSTRQTYVLSVVDNIPNRPPAFTTVPVVDAFLGTQYYYDSDAEDADGDALTYAVAAGPAGMTIDATTGAVTWDITDAALIGQLVPVTLVVTETGQSGPGHEAMQDYLIAVHAAIGNQDPVIISTPETTFALPNVAGNPVVGDVTPTSIDLRLLPGEQSEQTVSLSYVNENLFTADIVFLVDESASMGGDQAWVAQMVDNLDTALEGAGITENRFALVGFGENSALFATTTEPFRISVYGPDDALVQSIWVPTEQAVTTAVAGIELPADGEYTVVIDNGLYGAQQSLASDYRFYVEDVPIEVTTAALTLNATTGGTLADYAARHDYTFTLASAAQLYFDTQTDSDLVEWQISNASGEVVPPTVLNAPDALFDLAAGDYTLSLEATVLGSHAYSFALRDLSTGTALTVGTPVTATLAPASETDVYQITVATAGKHDFTMTAWDGSPLARWRLLDASGATVFDELLTTDRTFVDLQAATYTLLVEGPVAIEIFGDTDPVHNTVNPSYTISVAAAPGYPLTGVDYVLGSTVSETAGGDITQDTYNFTLNQTTLVFLDMLSNHDSFDGDPDETKWTLVGTTSGTVINGELLQANKVVLSLAADSYSLKISNSWQTPPYSFRLLDVAVEAVDIPAANFGVTQSGTLTPAKETDVYKFDAVAASTFDFDNLSWSGGSYGRWQLVNASTAVVFDQTIATDQLNVALTTGGTYYLLLEGSPSDVATSRSYSFTVDESGGGGGGGSYQLNGTAVSLGQVVSNFIEYDFQYYNFTLAQDALVYLDVLHSATSSQSIYWSLNGAAGNYVSGRNFAASNAGSYSSGSGLVFSLPAGGYNLEIDGDFSNGETYSFRLLDVADAGLTDVNALALDTTTSGTLDSPAREAHAYRFDAVAGQSLDFDSLTSTAHADARWRLIGPDGTIVFTQPLTTDQTGIALSAAGTYSLLIEGGTTDTSSTRSYSFQVIDQGIAPQPLTLGATVLASLSTTSEVDQYTFTLAAATKLYFDALAGDADFVWTLADDVPTSHVTDRSWTASDGAGIADGSVVLDLAAGNYTLSVETGTVTGDYSFRLLDLASTTPLTVGTATNGTLQPGAATDRYAFTVTAGERFLLDVSNYGGPAGGHWRLLDASSSVVGSGSLADSATAIDLTSGGSYTLLIEGDIADTTATQDYTLTVDLLSIATTQTLALATTTSGSIATAGTVDEYTYAGTAGERLFLDVLSADADQFTLTLYGGDGRVLLEITDGEDDTATAAALAAVTLDATETYSLIVSHSGGGIGAYSFRVLDVAVQPQLQFEIETVGALAVTNEDDLFRFTGTAGQRLIVRQDSWGDATQLADAIDLLSLEDAQTEDGYLGLDTALNNLNFRANATTHFVIVTDEDRDIVNGSLTSTGMLADLQAAGVTLHSVVTVWPTANDPLGVSGPDPTDTAYYADGVGGFTTAARGALVFDGADSDITFALGANIDQYYRDVAYDTGGSVWDLNQLRAGGLAGGLVGDSFTLAFVDQLGININAALAVDLVATDAGVDFEILSETVAGSAFTYDVRFTGDGIPHGFDLQFVREANPGVVLGSLPVTMWTGYTYDVNAIDPDADPLTYTMVGDTHGATFDAATGLLRWAPITTGDYEFTARVTDGRGGEDIQTWTVTVAALGAGNTAPVLAAAGPVTLQSDREFALTMSATDVDGDVVLYQILDDPTAGKPLPTGMTIDPFSGAISWTPAEWQAGQHTITVRAVDGKGGIDTTDVVFTVEIPTIIEGSGNRRPDIISTAVLVGEAGFEYRYDVNAIDPDGDPLTYELAVAPEGMVIDPDTGEIVWMPWYYPSEWLFAWHGVVVVARDGRGGSTTQGYDLQVTENIGPTIHLYKPEFVGVVGELYTYQAIAIDPTPNDVLTYSLINPPAGAGVNPATGFLSWTPESTDRFTIVIMVTDLADNASWFGYYVYVTNPPVNSAPEIISIPQGTIQAGQTFQHQLIAVDPDGDPLTYSLVNPPGSMTVSSSGLITWSTGSGDINTPGSPHQYTVKVEDGQGGIDQVLFTLDVVSSLVNTPPTITSTPALSVTAGANYAYSFTASDPDVGDTLTWSLIAAPVGMAFDDPQNPTQLQWTPGGDDVGTHAITLRVTDSASNYNEQSFTLAVRTANVSPTLVPGALVAVANQAYLYQFQANDPDGDPLTYSLVSGPAGVAVTASGILSWAPTTVDVNDPLVPYQVTVSVNDGNGGNDQLAYNLHVVLDRENAGPEITSMPTQLVTVGDTYIYEATAVDPDGDAVFWTLDEGPTGMTLDRETGRLVWGPSEFQIGEQTVTLRVSDAFGAGMMQQFILTVRGTNAPPLITSTPPTATLVGEAYVYDVEAVDPDGDPLTYELAMFPAGMLIDPSTGVITWTAPSADTGTIIVRVSDGRGGTVTQTFNLVATDLAVNHPPELQAIPQQQVATTAALSYQVIASDIDSDPLTYALLNGYNPSSTAIQTVPAGMTIDANGLITWATPVSGAYLLRVSVTDGIETRYTTLYVWAYTSTPPTITPLPDVTITAGRALNTLVRASDIDEDYPVLSYSLVNPPAGMTIIAYGRPEIDGADSLISWQTAIADIGVHAVQIEVADGEGGVASASFNVTVVADTTAPNVIVNLSDNPPLVGTNLVINVAVSDDGTETKIGCPDIRIIIDGEDVPGDEDGTVDIPIDDTTPFDITVIVTDDAGNQTTVITPVAPIDPSDVNAPLVSFATPAEYAELTEPTAVTGTVDDPDDNLTSWTLTAVSLQTGIATQIATGTTEVIAGTLGTLDTSSLINGVYRLELTATDTGGNTSTATRNVTIGGDLKIGAFAISFVDLQVPVSGLPITLTRSYSSIRANTSDDFGYGWTLDVANTAIDVTHPDDSLSGFGQYTPFRDGTRVVFTLPDGSTEGFTFVGVPGETAFGLVLNWLPSFVADIGNKSKLLVDTDGLSLKKEGDEYVSVISGAAYNPALYEFGGAYTFVTSSGMELAINAETGDLASITDRNDNTLYYSEYGIQSSAGRGVVFQRDYAGRITTITDPGGHSINYTYSADGDLIAVTDRAGSTTQFTYHDGTLGPVHFLDDIIDPLGRPAAKTTYNGDGRVETITDADGKTIQYTYNTGGSTQTITDQLGNTTTITFDNNGNITREVDPLGGITTRTYDVDENLTSETTVIGLEDATSAETDDLTVTYTYNADNNLLAQTAPDGNTTYYSYNSYGQPLTVTDPLGNTTRNTYSNRGNLTDVTDPLGNKTHFNYEEEGNVDLVSDSTGNTTIFDYNSYGDLLWTYSNVTYSFDNIYGDPVVTINPNSQRTDFTYDDLGQQIGTSFTWTDPNNPLNTATITTSTIYDYNGRATGSTDANGHSTATVYDYAGQVISTTDIYNKTTTTLYDPRGQAIEMTYGDGTITRTLYDAKGRALYTTDRHVATDPTQGTHYIYDALDRVVETRRYDNVVIAITTANGASNSSLTSVGIQLSSNTSSYDPVSGRLLSSTSSTGVVTTPEYDAFGRTVATNTTDNLTTRRTEYTYDDYGRQSVVKDSYGRETRTVFDDYGRVIETVYHDGTSSTTLYDADGRVSSSTDRFGNTSSYTYDSKGRRATSTNADGLVTTFEYDSYGRQSAVSVSDGTDTQRTEYEYDQFGRQVLVRDALGREMAYTYDSFGNVVTTVYDDASSTSATYGDYGRLVSETNAMGLTKNYEYDAQGRLTAVILPEVTHPDTGVTVRPRYEYDYDDRGNRTVIRDNVVEINGVVTYDHDGVAGDDVRETIFTYDDFGNELSRTLPMGEQELFEYDAVTHRLARHTSFEGNVTDRVYGDFGFLDELRYWDSLSDPDLDPANEVVDFAYDAFDRKSTTTDARGNTNFAYDDYNRITQIDSPEGKLNYEYDSRGRKARTSVGDPLDPTHDWTYTYDTWGRLETVSTVERNDVALSSPEVTTYSYDLVGNLARTDQSNGVIAVYTYDTLNRLDVLTHYAPDATPSDLTNNTKLYEFDYAVRADGRRTGVVETYWDGGLSYITTTGWTYDNLGRLVTEVYDSHDNSLDYTTNYEYDLVGSRLKKEVDQGSDTTIDETTTYNYDNNDRLLSEAKVIGQVDSAGNTERDDTTTNYTYNGTAQASKTLKATYSNNTLNDVNYEYDLRNRLSKVVIDSYDANGDIVKKETTTYGYDENGIRRTSTHKIEEDTDGLPTTALVVTTNEKTDYLVNPSNFTGYAQVVEEVTTDIASGIVTSAKVFTLGHDVIDQTTFTPGDLLAGTPLIFLHDGHGSTRALIDNAAAFVQRYAYDAYGIAIGFDEAAALTSLLYSGEAFDARIGLQYLRARWYNPNTGGFNRLDPFSGNLSDPQSLHKYLYGHGDPVNGIDPSGMYLAGLLTSMGSRLNMSTTSITVMTKAISGAVAGAAFSAISASLDKHATAESIAMSAAYGAGFGLAFGALAGISEIAALITGITTLTVMSPYIWANVKDDWEKGNHAKVYFDVGLLLISVPMMLGRLATIAAMSTAESASIFAEAAALMEYSRFARNPSAFAAPPRGALPAVAAGAYDSTARVSAGGLAGPASHPEAWHPVVQRLLVSATRKWEAGGRKWTPPGKCAEWRALNTLALKIGNAFQISKNITIKARGTGDKPHKFPIGDADPCSNCSTYLGDHVTLLPKSSN